MATCLDLMLKVETFICLSGLKVQFILTHFQPYLTANHLNTLNVLNDTIAIMHKVDLPSYIRDNSLFTDQLNQTGQRSP